MAAGMTRMPRILDRGLILLAVIAAPLVGGCQAEGKTMAESMNAIDHIVEQVRAAGRVDRPLAAAIVHVALRKTADTGYFETYEATDIKLGDLAMTAELRSPVEGSGATAGALLVLRILKGCPSKADVEARYAPLKIANIPHGRSPDEETNWSRDEPWGHLSFGFAERAPDCLSSITFQGRERP
jgi:hypothetical protein